MVKPIKTKEKWKGKDWYQILAPKSFKNVIMGETPAIDQAMIKNRVIESSLLELTNNPSKYYTKLFFRVIDFDGNKALTSFWGHDTTRDFIARIVHVGSTRIDTNDVYNLKDGKLRLKTIMVTNRKIQVPLSYKIRKLAMEMISKEVSEMTFEDFTNELNTGKLAAKIRSELNKLYPVRFFEFRKSQVLA